MKRRVVVAAFWTTLFCFGLTVAVVVEALR
jgi:hypothetical protein